MKAAPHMSTNGDEMKAAPHIRLNGGAGASSLEDDEQFEARKHEWQVRYASAAAQPRPTAVSVTLPAVVAAAEIDISHRRAGRSAANRPHTATAVARWDRQTDGQTDGRTLDCCIDPAADTERTVAINSSPVFHRGGNYLPLTDDLRAVVSPHRCSRQTP